MLPSLYAKCTIMYKSTDSRVSNNYTSDSFVGVAKHWDFSNGTKGHLCQKSQLNQQSFYSAVKKNQYPILVNALIMQSIPRQIGPESTWADGFRRLS